MSSAGPFTATFVAASNLSVGAGVVVIVSSLAHLTASARFRARAPGPVSGRLSGTTGWRGAAIVSRFPVAFPQPAFASRSSDSRRGVGPSSRSAYRDARARPDPDGVTAFRTHELRPGWVPPIPRGRRCSSRPRDVLSRRLPLLRRPVLAPRSDIPPRGALLHEASTRVHAIHPSGLPLACSRPGGTGALGLSPELRTPPLPATHVEGGDRPSSTDLELRLRHQPNLQSACSLVACDLASHRPKQASRPPLPGRLPSRERESASPDGQ